MPKMHVIKSATIQAPPAKVFNLISNLNSWTVWSPWLIAEPEATVTISPDHLHYRWEGKRVGTGEMRITGQQAHEWVDYDLTFLKPWKSQAKVRFELKASGAGTQVDWQMDSQLPFFMIIFKNMMTAFVGMDFERGLKLLKDYAEDDVIHSKLEFTGIRAYPGCQYIGIVRDSEMAGIGENMSADFTRLLDLVGESGVGIAGELFSTYHKWNIVKGTTRYTAGIPVTEIPSSLPAGIISGNLDPVKVFTIRHIGPYHHLANAWTTIQMMMRGKEFVPAKGKHPFESYVNDPAEVPENELITDINFVIKG